ncbi:MAG: DUF6445 family protein [Terricaulis sp.]
MAFIGHEHQPVAIVENFSPHPERLIDEASRLRFEVMGEFYPGVRANATPAYFEGQGPLLARVLSEFFDQKGRFESQALYSLATTPSDQLTLAQRIPHIDGLKPGMIAILHYLSREPFGGTAFYRHRSTGFETIDARRHPLYLERLHAGFAAHGEPPPRVY